MFCIVFCPPPPPPPRLFSIIKLIDWLSSIITLSCGVKMKKIMKFISGNLIFIFMNFSFLSAMNVESKLQSLGNSLNLLKSKLLLLNNKLTQVRDKLDGTEILNEFLKKYQPPKELIDFIDKYKNDPKLFIPTCFGHITYDGKVVLSNYFHKGSSEFDAERLFNCEKLRKCVQDKGLNLIRIPRKYVYKMKIERQTFYGSYEIVDAIRVFAETILSDNTSLTAVIGSNVLSKPLSLDEVKQLATLMEETGYSDSHKDNIIRANDDKIAIIDTDSNAFKMGWGQKTETLKEFLKNFTKEPNLLDSNAKHWLENRIKTLEDEVKLDPSKNNIDYVSGGNINIKAYSDPIFEKVLPLLKKFK